MLFKPAFLPTVSLVFPAFVSLFQHYSFIFRRAIQPFIRNCILLHTLYEELTNYPYLLDVQSDIIDDLTTRLIIPLFDTRHLQAALPIRLNPIIDIEGQPFVLMTHLMSAISKSMLGKEIICIEYQRDKIKSAIDLLVDGF